MILRMIVALRAVMHVRDLRLIVVARCVWILMIVVALTRIALAGNVASRRGAPREPIVAVVYLIHRRRRIARRRQLTRAGRERRRGSGERAAGAAALRRSGSEPRINGGGWIAGGGDQRRVWTRCLFASRRRSG